MKKTHLLYAVTALATLGAIWLVSRALGQYGMDEILSSLEKIPARSIMAAAFFAAGSYVCLTFFDYFGLRYCGKPLRYRQAALASFTGLSIGHNVGVAALSSGAVRYRFYARWGLSNEDVAKVVLFCGATVGIGLITLAGLCLAVNPDTATRLLAVDTGSARGLGAGLLLLTAAYVVAAARVRKSVRIFRWTFTMPPFGLAMAQVVVGSLNFALVAACLHSLLDAGTHYTDTVSAYVVGNIAAIASHVPGGLGVLEATISIVSSGAATVAALIMFRVIYFFVPLAGGVVCLLLGEWLIGRRPGQAAEAA